MAKATAVTARKHKTNPKSVKGRTFPAEVLTPDEVTKLLRACSNRAPTGIRNRALIAMLYRAGLRISEALSLMPKDLDAKGGSVRVLRGKGNKARTVGMDAEAFAIIDRWLDTRKRLGITDRRTVFCTLKGGPVTTDYIRAMFPRIARRAGISKRVHAHGFRHTHAAELAAEGIPLNVIQRQLGHANLAVTSIYLDHIAPADVIAAVGSRAWAEPIAPNRRASRAAGTTR